jgi:flagellar L-ring protein precursor FlgH
MKRFLFIAYFLALVAPSFSDDAQKDANPGSLWTNESSNLCIDARAHKEGDIITIQISEASTATLNATSDNEKTEADTVGPTTVPILSSLIPGLANSLSASTSGSLSAKSTGSTTNNSTFTYIMSAVVKKVLPNGNLVIEGKRSVTINKDIQTFVLSGIVRPTDISASNTVLSENLADATITVGGKGPVAEKQRKGILTRLFDWLF